MVFAEDLNFKNEEENEEEKKTGGWSKRPL